MAGWANFRGASMIACLSVPLGLAGCAQDSSTGNVDTPSSLTTASGATSTSSSAATATEAPAAEHFTQVASTAYDGGKIYGNDKVFVIPFGGGYKSFEADGTPLGTLTSAAGVIEGFCGMFVSTAPDGTTSLFTMRDQDIPAAGLDPAMTAFFVTAWDAKTFSKRWETEVAREESGGPGPCSSGSNEIRGTTDGKCMTVSYVAEVSAILDARTGQKRTVEFDPAPVGDFIATFQGSCPNCLNGLESVQILDPATLSRVSDVDGRNPRTATQDPGTPIGVLAGAVGMPERAAWFKSGDRVAMAHAGMVRILNIKSNTIEKTMQIGDGDTSVSGSLILDEANQLLILHESAVGRSETSIRAFSLESGSEVWTQQRVSDLCAVASEQVSVVANDQLILLDEASGRQLDYTTTPSSCAAVFGAYSVDDSGAVYRLTD